MRIVSQIVFAVVTILILFEYLDIFLNIDFKVCSFGVFEKSCHDTNVLVFLLLRYFTNSLFFFRVLYSTSRKCGSNSAMSFSIEILSFSLPMNFPPSVVGRNVHTHLLIYFLTRVKQKGI